MSTYDDASLVLVPSGYKNGVVFSQKPMDANGQLTFTRASSATRVGPNGYIEKVRTNYCRYSQDFVNGWSLLGSATRTGGVTDPNGGTTAVTISNIPSGNIADGIALYSNPMTIGAEPIIGSVWLKGSGTIAIALERGISGDYFFYVTDVTLTSTWTRYSIGGALAGARDGFTFYVCNRTGTTATSVDVAFAQVEFGDVATDYIPTTTAAVSVGPVSGTPRLDYLGSDCPRLLLEPAATALNTKSEDINGWLSAGGTSSANTTETLDPSGYYGADIMNESCVRYFNAPSSSATYTFSCFAKAKTGTDFNLRIDTPTTISATFNLSTGAISGVSASITPQIQNYGNGWWRCAITFTQPIVNYVVQTGPTSKCYVWGANLVQAAYATSYIPTLGTSVTRVADLAQKASASALIGQTEGTIFWEFEFTTSVATANEALLNIDNGSFGNTVYITKSSSGGIVAEMYSGGVLQASLSLSSQPAGTYKAAFGYANNNTAFFVNGVQVGTTDTSCSVPAMNRIQLGNGELGPSTDKTAQVLLFKTRLTNAQLAELTTL
jgi:hypothetical protein